MIKLWMGSIGSCFIGSVAAMGFYIAGLPSSVQAEIDQSKLLWISGQNGLIAGAVTGGVLSALGFGKPSRKDLMPTTDPKATIAQRMSDPTLTASEFVQLSEALVKLETIALERPQQVLASPPQT